MKTRIAVSIAALTAALSSQPLLAQEMKAKPPGDAAPMMTIDRDTFLKMVGSANEWEIQSSELAEQKSSSAGIKDVGKMIIADHTKAGEKLKATLESKGGQRPPPELSAKHRIMLDQLQASEGTEFDVLYVDMQSQAHMEAIALFRTFAGSGDDQELVGFAKETLPNLEKHMAHVAMLVAGEH